MRYFRIGLLTTVLLCSFATAERKVWRQEKALAIKAVEIDKSVARVFDRVTMDVDLEATFDNPFDSNDITLDAAVIAGSGERWSVPGFFYRPYRRNDSMDSPRRTEPAGDCGWRVRLSFVDPDWYTVKLKAKDRSGTVESAPMRIRVIRGDKPGMIRRSDRDHRYFVTDRGESWFAVGANVCWGETWGEGGKHVFAYDDWFPKYAANGCNYARLWLSLEWNDLAIITTDSGYNGIDLKRAWHIDHVLELAEKHDIRLMFCFDAHGMLRTQKRLHGFWEMSPLHPDHGAPIAKPVEFFTNEKMLAAYRDRLRYIVARYGYSTGVFSWEFFNEVDLIDDYDSELIAGWHKEMAKYLRDIDPWKHLISTSYARHHGDPRVDGLAELDYVQTHHYQAPDIARELARDAEHKAAAKDRPHFVGEFGINHSGSETGKLDPTGIHLHNGLYSSVGRMDAGTAMTWWWDSYVHPRDLYHIFGAFSRWIEGFDFVEQNPRAIEADFKWKAGTKQGLSDFELRTSGVSWNAAPYNKPLKVKVLPDGEIVAAVKPGGILHGLRNHPDLHNPVTFELDVPRATKFVVQVGDVSGFGGAAISIRLDGAEKLRKDFPDKKEKGGTLTQFRGDYSIDLPAGKHTVVVECVGKDWFMVSGYRVEKLITPAKPQLRSSGIIGRDRGLVWVQNPKYTWSANVKPNAVTDGVLVLSDIKPGPWTIEHFDSHAGRVTKTENASASADGQLEIVLPDIQWDAAFRLRAGR